MKDYFLGENGFVWFMGVVESRQDPLKLGRVRVRIFGVHSDNKEILSTDSLPWASVMLPVISSGISGFGWSKSFLVEGSVVMGYYRDGGFKQEPIILGSLPGKPFEYGNPNKGFNDPNRRSADEESADYNVSFYPRHIGESDVSRLAVSEQPHFSRPIDLAARLTNITAITTTWNQPAISGLSTYPYNNTYETESGHFLEFDDTTGNERIRLRHRLGSSIEMKENGDIIAITRNNSYTITNNNNYVYITGDSIITVNGNVELKGNNNISVSATNNISLNAGGSISIAAGGPVTVNGSTINLN
jgi:hypothetical protein